MARVRKPKAYHDYEQLELDFDDAHTRVVLVVRSQLLSLMEHVSKTVSLCHALRAELGVSPAEIVIKERLLIKATYLTRVRDAEKQAQERLRVTTLASMLASYHALHKAVAEALPLLDRARKFL